MRKRWQSRYVCWFEHTFTPARMAMLFALWFIAIYLVGHLVSPVAGGYCIIASIATTMPFGLLWVWILQHTEDDAK